MANEWLYRPTSLCGLGFQIRLPPPQPSSSAFFGTLWPLCLCLMLYLIGFVQHLSSLLARWCMVAKDSTFFTCLFREESRCRKRGSVSLSFGSDPFTWHKLVVTHCTLDNFEWDLTELPYWRYHFLRANAANSLTGAASTAAHRFYDLGYALLQDFVD
ncbi:unnamed protein product [Peronospora farinosa]|uniref:Uncharacterized protein n=1 Tax=Peronospora farinosa TaxID=134698 RepID=A0AAV0SUZ4_9STRA|nr:unnamed protein product [Peronospora farinosa]CAI5708368.1 unnamed protein product [Peronospora farinosa]